MLNVHVQYICSQTVKARCLCRRLKLSYNYRNSEIVNSIIGLNIFCPPVFCILAASMQSASYM